MGSGSVVIALGFISVMEQLLNKHGVCELDIVDSALFLLRSSSVGKSWRLTRVNSRSRLDQAVGRPLSYSRKIGLQN